MSTTAWGALFVLLGFASWCALVAAEVMKHVKLAPDLSVRDVTLSVPVLLMVVGGIWGGGDKVSSIIRAIWGGKS